MSDIFRTIPCIRTSRIGKKFLLLLAVAPLFTLILSSPVSAAQRMVLAEGYTNYQ